MFKPIHDNARVATARTTHWEGKRAQILNLESTKTNNMKRADQKLSRDLWVSCIEEISCEEREREREKERERERAFEREDDLGFRGHQRKVCTWGGEKASMGQTLWLDNQKACETFHSSLCTELQKTWNYHISFDNASLVIKTLMGLMFHSHMVRSHTHCSQPWTHPSLSSCHGDQCHVIHFTWSFDFPIWSPDFNKFFQDFFFVCFAFVNKNGKSLPKMLSLMKSLSLEASKDM